MAKHVIEDPIITLNSVDLSGRVKKVTFLIGKRPPQNLTAMTDGWEDLVHVDIKKFKASFEFYQDYAASSVYATIKAIYDLTTSFTVVVRPTTAARSSTNPEWSGSMLLDGEFPVIDASEPGAVNMQPINFLGTGALSFLTSSS